MADEQITSTEQETISTQLQESVWGDVPVAQPVSETAATSAEPTTAVTNELAAAATTAADPNEEVLDQKDWLKREFGIEDVAVLKAERDEYRKLKETPPTAAEIKFADDQSKLIHELIREGKTKEVRQFLETQERIESLVGSDVNKDTAAEIIKLGMQLKYKDLSPKEIEYKFNKQFAIPKEPVQATDELDEEFAERKATWQEQVSDIEMNKIIEAKLAKPELESAKSKLVLPEISPKENTATEPKPTQEELDAFDKLKSSFIQSAETTVNGFNGFTAQVKDKDVDYSVSYSPSQEEKTIVGAKMKEFATAGLNANALFADRWVNEDGTINVPQMTEDLSRVYMGKNADQKIATEAANQRLELYLKGKKNININETRTEGQFSNDLTESQRLQEAVWGN